jgi:hemoglobin-like flavoprotein
MKLLLACVVLGCVAAWAAADEENHTCGSLEKIKVRRQWEEAYGEGRHRLDFALHFWSRFFKDHPKARDAFKAVRGDNIYSDKFQAFSQRRLAALGMVIETTDDPEALKVMAEYAKADDKAAGVGPEFYDDIRISLLETLAEYIGNHFDWDAWNDCLTALVAGLKP